MSDYLQVLDAQRILQSSRQRLAQQKITLANDVDGLYRALGGGWEAPGVQSQAPFTPRAAPIAPAALDSLAAAQAK